MTEQQQTVGRIAIAVHVFDRIDFDIYFNHMWCIAHWAREYDLVFIGKSGLQAAMARNFIIERALEKECSYALFIDGDHFIPIETLPYLLESRDQAMVSGLVCKKGEGFQQVCWLIKEVDGKDAFFQLELPLDGALHEVSVVPFGCTLVNLEKLRRLKRPYFRDTCTDKDDNGLLNNIRSDINICRAFSAIGEQLWVDTRILVGHKGVDTVVYPQSAKLFHKLKEIEMETNMLREGQVGKYYVVGDG